MKMNDRLEHKSATCQLKMTQKSIWTEGPTSKSTNN